MAISFVAASSVAQSTSSTDVNLPKPSGTLQGHVIVACVETDQDFTVTNPSGWVTIRAINTTDGANLHTAYRIVGASDPATYTFVLGTASQRATASAITFSGVDNTSPLRTDAGSGWGSGVTSHSSPSLTGVQATDMVVIFGGGINHTANASFALDAPATGGWTSPAAANSGRGVSAFDFYQVCDMAYQINGTTGNVTTSSVAGIVTIAAALAPAAGDYGASVDVFQSDVTVEPGTSNIYTEVRIPAVVKTSTGTLVAFAEGRHIEGDFGNIDLIARRSTDGGATWGSVFKVKENGTNTVGNPVPIVNGSDIYLMYTKQDASGGSNRFPFVTKSTDDGVTWSASTDLSSLRPSGWTWFATGPGHGIRTEAGRLIVPINGNHPTTGYHAGCIYSDDGVTWVMGTTISDSTGVRNYNESTIAELTDGVLVMFSRNEGGTGPDRIRSISNTGGASWTSPGDSGMVSTFVQGSVLQHGPIQNGSKLVFSGSDNPSTRHNMVLRISTNGGTVWTTSHTIWRLEDTAYSDLCPVSNNSVGLLYERGTANAYENITWVRVPINQITQVGTATTAGTGATADTNSLVVNKPTGTALNDVLVAAFTCNSVTVTPPSGFTEFASTSNSTLFTRLYYKVAGGSEPATYTWGTSANGPIHVALTAWRGCDTADPIANDPATSNSTGATEPVTTPTMTANDTTTGRMFFVRSSFISSATPISFASTAFTQEVFETSQTTPGNTSRTQALYGWNHDFEGTAAAKPGVAVTATGTEANNTAFTFALRAQRVANAIAGHASASASLSVTSVAFDDKDFRVEPGTVAVPAVASQPGVSAGIRAGGIG